MLASSTSCLGSGCLAGEGGAGRGTAWEGSIPRVFAVDASFVSEFLGLIKGYMSYMRSYLDATAAFSLPGSSGLAGQMSVANCSPSVKIRYISPEEASSGNLTSGGSINASKNVREETA